MKRPYSWKTGAWLIAPALGLFLFAPTFVVGQGFQRWVDVPACSALCEERGLRFRSFRTAGKRGQYCTCSADAAEQTFHRRFTVTGGDSTLEHVLDWVVRTGAVLLMIAAWITVAYLVTRQWKKRRAGSDQAG